MLDPAEPRNDVARRVTLANWEHLVRLAQQILEGEDISQMLRFKHGELKGTLYKKPHRWSKPGTAATRCGIAPLRLLTLEPPYKNCVFCYSVAVMYFATL